MNDSDPRPMPPEVQRAYRDPLKLTELLDSHAYSESDRLFVRDELLRALVSRFGEVEVFVGDKGRAQKVSTRVKSFKKNWLASIDLMLDVEQFGEREVTLPMLARIMEPRWQTWWSTWQVKMTPSLIYRRWSDVVVLVLGERQIRWVAAHIAREKLRGQDRQDDIDAVLTLVEAVERYCVRPTTETQRAMNERNEELRDYMTRTQLATPSTNVRFPPMEDAFSASVKRSLPMYLNWMQMDFRRFFTPTLITDPSRGLR